MIPVVNSEIDVLVVGGGGAGVSAATSAAKNGATVRLIDQNGFLGGVLVSGMVGGLCGMFSVRRKPEDNPYQIVGGIGEEIRARIAELGGMSGVNTSKYFDTYRYDPNIMQIALDEIVVKYDVKVTLHTLLIDVTAEDGKVISVETASKSGREIIKAKCFIDATGDADIVYMAGGAYEKSNNLQPGSLNFRMAGVDPSKGVPGFAELTTIMKNEKGFDPKIKSAREDPMFLNSPTYEQVICGFSRIPVDGTNAQSLTDAEFEGRRQVLPVAEFIKQKFPAFENAYVSGIASQIGIRQTRIIEGEEIITGQDVLKGRKRENAIGRNAWPIERHVIGKSLSEIIILEEGDYYEIPFGAIIPKGFKNLLVAGRCISSDGPANASVRVFGPCSVTGMAAGTAAALLVKRKHDDVKLLSVNELQKQLIRDGARI